MFSSTIAAIATSAGRGGIGIVRISGPEAFTIGNAVFTPKAAPRENNGSASFVFKSHQLYYGTVHEVNTSNILDEVLAVFMKSPNTYTREDVVEIQGHAGYQTLQAILHAVINAGAVLATPGEFTKRAFLNGRIDLTQAEAVADLITANSQQAREIALAQVEGLLGNRIAKIRRILFEHLTSFQAQIEFGDDVPSNHETFHLSSFFESSVCTPLKQLIENHFSGEPLRHGLRTLILGAPNVGKSSLMNCLSGRDKSLVTAYPGTTRDLIDEYIQLQGAPVIITDTAGIHDSKDPVESMGIEKALQQIDQSDLILFVLQAGQAFGDNEIGLLKNIQSKPVIFVINKIDLYGCCPPLNIPEHLSQEDFVFISATKQIGIPLLEKKIEQQISLTLQSFNDPVIPNLRQKILLEEALSETNYFLKAILQKMPIDLLVIHLERAIDQLDQVTGHVFDIDILDSIFSTFCIGK